MRDIYDVIIIGAGAMGSSAAHFSARAGLQVLVLEQFELGHVRGGSHGGTRIFRFGTEEKEYLDLTERSKELWRSLEADAGETLLTEVGAVEHGVDDRAVEQFDALLGIRGIAHDVLAPEECQERWPGMRFDGPVLYQPGGGCLFADRTVAALQRLAGMDGATFAVNQRVQSIRPVPGSPTRVEVETQVEVFLGRHVIVTAGPWAPGLLRGLMDIPSMTVTDEQPRHFAARENAATWPCFVQWRHDDGPYGQFESYGLVEDGLGVKVGLHGSGPVIDLDNRDDQQNVDVENALRQYVHDWFPGLDADQSTTNNCLYDNTTTNRFVIDRIGPVTVATGFHGQGFKFVPVMGELLRDLATGDASPPTFFRLAAHG